VHPQGNILSLLAFFGWIPLALWVARRWPAAVAAGLLLVVPALFLPERMSFKLPGLPPFGKDELAVFWLLIAVVLFHRQRLRELRLDRSLKVVFVVIVVGLIATVFLNADPISNVSVQIPGHRPYDTVHFLISSALAYILPFMVAAAMFKGPGDLRVLFRLLVGAALVYSVFQIIEIRFSPQFHKWFYGYHQSYFLQAKRDGGFRPMVFMEHGLAVAMFTFVGAMAAVALYRTKLARSPWSPAWAAPYLWVILLLSNSQAALLYSVVAAPLIWFGSPKTQHRAAVMLAVVLLSYPVLRSSGLVPVDVIGDVVVEQFGEERGRSLMTRFENEELLLERANERALFGWGAYCRPCIFHAWTGEELSLRDGDWIITYGGFGIVGFYGKYLLLLLPVFISARRRKRILRESDRRLLAALSVIIGFCAFDLIPNGQFNYLVFALSGALLGCSRGAVAESAKALRARRERAIQNSQRSLHVA